MLLPLQGLNNLFFEKRLLMRNLMDLFFVIRFSEGSSKIFQFSQTSVDGEIKELGLTRFARGIMWLLKEIFNLDPKFMPVDPLEEEGQYLLGQIMGEGFTFHNWWHRLWHYTWHNLT